MKKDKNKDKAKILELEAKIEHLELELWEAREKNMIQEEKLDCIIDFVNQNYLKDLPYQIKGFDYEIIYNCFGIPCNSKPVPVFYKKEDKT